MMKKLVAMILAMAMTVSLVACSSSSTTTTATTGTTGTTTVTNSTEAGSGITEASVQKDTLTVVLSSEPLNLNPQTCNRLNGYIAEFLIYDTLLQKDEDGNILPNLATEWEMIDDTHLRMTIRDDVTFSNGVPLTAEDVVYTIYRASTMATTMSTFQYFDGENTYAEDDYTVVIALVAPFAGVYDFLTHAYSSIVCKSYIEEVGDDVAGIEPIGTGAYVLDTWTTGSSLLLTRNENYWGEPGASENILLKVITEQANRAIELETGGADIALDLSTTDAVRVAQADGLVLEETSSYKTTFIGLNQSKEIFQDSRIGEALSYATNVEALTLLAYSDFGIAADSIMAPTILGYTSLGEHVYDVDKAIELLAEAGYPDGITLTGRTQTNSDFATMAEVLQNMWSAAGITLDIQVLDSATYSELGKTDGGTDITITSQTATTGNAFQAVGTIFSTASVTGIISSSDTVLEQMIADASAIYDDEARYAAYADIQERIVFSYYAIPVSYPSITTGTSDKVKDFIVSPSNAPDFTYVSAWE